MPLVSLVIGQPSSGASFSILLEKVPGTNYNSLIEVIKEASSHGSSTKGTCMSKSEVKALLTICQSDRERECVRYAICKASGLSQKQIRAMYGFENISSRVANVEAAIKDVQDIREAIEELASVQDKAAH